MKKINIEELFNNNFDCHTIEVMNWKQVEVPALTKDKFKELCINLSKQLLELAAENIEFIETTSSELNCYEYKPFITADDNTIWTIDKQSILDTIKQVE